jgi:HK97 family phage prohead protease
VLLAAGAIDGLSIGYRTIRSERATGGRRLLHEVELWEVSLVTFPMLPEARVLPEASDPDADLAQTLAETFREAREMLA